MQLYHVVVTCNVTIKYMEVRMHFCASVVHGLIQSNVQSAVNSRRISGNLDAPEGGMDGLLQAVVCQDVGHCLMCTNVFLSFKPHTFYATDHWLETKPC